MNRRNKKIQRVNYDNITTLMIYEGCIASAYWSELSKIFNSLAKVFHFETRKNLSYLWNMNASDPVNALLNYGYAILESIIRKDINTIGLDIYIGCLHETAPSSIRLFTIYRNCSGMLLIIQSSKYWKQD
ncbi:CRISPR-associated endonuclease Cas1 [Thermoplasma sp. Kam2015]|uniref:CRISPR-associated endonuclease Cas1 n=1 Tax=Thermoplasma sp. Kam2015 TaxID=2094122 RepID=UPI00129401C4|nr:CRISPR-associated endonuclease Cas1 [Thermoplasma sp. Kam2015]